MADGRPVDRLAQIAADFDRIARMPEPNWTHNSWYHPLLLRHLKAARAQRVLEVGCGTGRLAASVAPFCREVLGIDLSQEMIAAATDRHGHLPNVRFVHGDYLGFESARTWDAIISVSTAHHLDLKAFLSKAARELQPGGQLLLVDLYEGSAADAMLNAAVLPLSLALRLWHNGRLRPAAAHAEAWKAHDQHDHFLSMPEIRRIASAVLPGCRITRTLFWRYFLRWVKPARI
ncbi:MAG: class I SAM-dependent methyltransferase [Saprospiraceae bacterium]|nr:class I SAM-dependent methyltransferase [Saprospiraceae bacterium]